GALDRSALATLVFADPEALKDLNAMVHPAVRKAFAEWATRQHAPYVIMEAALLAETGGYKYLDEVILVSAPKDLRIKRTMARDGVGEEAVLARMRNQATEDQRKSIAEHVILNDDSVLVIPQVLALHEVLLQASS
ncbi:MAG: dephospho-CoA kinase, partial [Flavobacteriales bacterium]